MRSIATLLLLSSCVALNSTDDPLTRILANGATHIDELSGFATAAATLEDPEATPFVGRYRLLHGPTSCDSAIPAQGNPAVHTQGVPTVGQPLQIQWTVNPTKPYDQDRPAYLLVWFKVSEAPGALAANLSPWGYRDCTLWAPLDGRKLHTVTPGGLLTQTGGRLEFNWTPTAEWVGRRLYSQLVVASPGANNRGWLLSPALETWVGNTDSK